MRAFTRFSALSVLFFGGACVTACGGTGSDDDAAGSSSGAASGSGGTGGTATTGGAGGAGAMGGSAGSGVAGMPYTQPSCMDSDGSPGRVTKSSPLVSAGARVTASEGVLNPASATDGKYHDGGGVVFKLPTEDEPAWIAIELEGSFERLLLTFADASWEAYTTLDFTPRSYRIEVSADSTDGEDGKFTTVAEVTDNPVRTREHAFDFMGKQWVRFVVTDHYDDSPAVRVDEFALYDVSASGGDVPEDTWFFLGDSITAGAFQRTFGAKNFDAVVTAAEPDFTPAYLNGGIGGELATGGLARLDQMLELNPDMKHVVIAYGTNDSWGNQDAENVHFEDTLNELVDRVLEADKVPILARIPYSSVDHGTLPEFNAVIDRITEERGLPCGADLYGFFLENQSQLSTDGVHPATPGYASMNEEWAKALLPLYAGD